VEIEPHLSAASVAAWIKRHTHDVRNVLNGMEMELTLILEAKDDTDQLAAVQRMRQEMRCAEALLRTLAGKFVVETKATICVSDLAEQWMSDARSLLPARAITWNLEAGTSRMEAEIGLLRGLLSDLLLLTARKDPRSSLEAACRVGDAHVIFSVTCSSPAAENSRSAPLEPLLWSSLRTLAARASGSLTETPPSYQLTFPVSASGEEA
jgi:hypothetical protein